MHSRGMPRILLDLSTSLAWRGKHAVGIVRTEREIAARLLTDDTIDVVPVVFHAGSLRALDPALAIEIVSSPLPSQSPAHARSVPLKPSPKSLLSRMLRPVRQRYARRISARLARVAKGIATRAVSASPQVAQDEIKQSLIHARQAIRNVIYRPAGDSGGASGEVASVDLGWVVHASQDDVLFVGGLGWDVLDCSALARIKAATGLKIVSVMYDLIPTNHPEFLGGEPRDYFLNYFLHMADLSEHVFCISKATQGDFLTFCEHEGRKAPPTSVLYLGCNVPVEASSAEIDDVAVRDRLSRGRYALTVGTFEVRKNYKVLLQMWPELVKDPDFDLDLVIVGMPGWRVDDVLSEMESSPLFGRRIFWFRKMSDAGLSWLYDNCQIFVFPSLYEGWGLPVVEALQHGRPAIISNRGATPEAGMGVATVIDPDARDEWMRHLRAYAKEGRSKITSPTDLPTWDDTATTVRSKLLTLAATEAAECQ